jgi:AcrR family transcriptional regulator
MDDSQSRASTRERLLAAGREMVLERFEEDASPADALAHLTPASVAQRAGVSRGSLYHYWGDAALGETGTDDADTPFRRFLEELAGQLWGSATGFEDMLLAALALPDNLSDVILALTAGEVARRTSGRPAASWRATVTMGMHGADLSEDVVASTVSVTRLYEAVLPRLGRRMRAPLRTYDLAQTIGCLADGMILNELLVPGSTTAPVDWTPSVEPTVAVEAWNLFAIAVESVALNMTEPIPEDEGPRRAPGERRDAT